MGIRADIKRQGSQADDGVGTTSGSPFEYQETTPRGRGGKKPSGAFVAHYYSVRSKLRRSDYLCELYCIIAYNLA